MRIRHYTKLQFGDIPILPRCFLNVEQSYMRKINTAAHHCTKPLFGDVPVSPRYFFDIGADPNAMNIYGFTPLHDAAYWGRADVAEVLLRYGADPSMKNNDGKTPLDLAKERGHTVVASILEKWMEGGGKGDGGVKVICDPYCETLKIIKQLHDIVMGSLRVTEREVEELASHVSNLRVHVDELTAIAAEIAPNAVRELVDSRKLIESAVDLLRQGNIQALREAVISRYYRMLSLGQRLGCRC